MLKIEVLLTEQDGKVRADMRTKQNKKRPATKLEVAAWKQFKDTLFAPAMKKPTEGKGK